MSRDFQMVHVRARDRVGERAWSEMTPHDQTEAIYRELRAFDAERIQDPLDANAAKPGDQRKVGTEA